MLSSCSRGEHRDEEDQFMEEQLVLDQWAAPSNTTSSVAGSSDRYTYTEDLKQLETNCPQIPPPLPPTAETTVSLLVIDN